jgi:hypothetical protein
MNNHGITTALNSGFPLSNNMLLTYNTDWNQAELTLFFVTELGLQTLSSIDLQEPWVVLCR